MFCKYSKMRKAMLLVVNMNSEKNSGVTYDNINIKS